MKYKGNRELVYKGVCIGYGHLIDLLSFWAE